MRPAAAGLLLAVVAVLASACGSSDPTASLVAERRRVRTWSQYVGYERRLAESHGDPAVAARRERFLDGVARDQGWDADALADLDRTRGRRWSRHAFCAVPCEPLRTHPFLLGPAPVSPLRAPYTAAARAHRVEGAVIFEVVLDRRGRATLTGVVRGLPDGLTESARRAVARSRWYPALLCGEPAAVRYHVSVGFELDGPAEDRPSVRRY